MVIPSEFPKAKELFREMMQQASNELGFEVDDIPLMIEAIPISSECLILIITKVEDPEELDTRFSRFTRNTNVEDDYEEDEEEEDIDYFSSDSDDEPVISGHIDIGINGDKSQVPEAIFDALEGFVNSLTGLAGKTSAVSTDSNHPDASASAEQQDAPKIVTKLVVFDSLNTIIRASKQIAGFYFSSNTLCLTAAAAVCRWPSVSVTLSTDRKSVV